MKKVLTDHINAFRGLPIGKSILSFIQEASRESIAALATAAGVHPTLPTALYGVEVNWEDPVCTNTAGAVYYQGEVYKVPAGTLTLPDPNPEGLGFYWTIEERFAPFDPIVYTTGENYNTCQDSVFKIAATTAEEGIVNLEGLYRLHDYVTQTGIAGVANISGAVGRLKTIRSGREVNIEFEVFGAAVSTAGYRFDLSIPEGFQINPNTIVGNATGTVNGGYEGVFSTYTGGVRFISVEDNKLIIGAGSDAFVGAGDNVLINGVVKGYIE